MKKIAIITAVLSAFVLIFTYCADLEFDNPLDSKGDNYLPGVDPQDREGALADAGNGLPDYWANPGQWICDRSLPNATLAPTAAPIDAGSGAAIIGLNTHDVFANIMGRGPNAMGGAFTWTTSNQENPALDDIQTPDARDDVKIYRSNAGWDKLDEIVFTGWNSGDPLLGVFGENRGLDANQGDLNYIIEYSVKRNMCSDGSQAERILTRRITMTIRTTVDERPPIIQLHGQLTLVHAMGTPYIDEGASIMEADGTRILSFSDIEIKRGGMTLVRSSIIPVEEGAAWVSDRINGAGMHLEEQVIEIVYYVESPRNNVVVSATRTVTVEPVIGPELPEIEIILNLVPRGNTIGVDTEAALVIGQGAQYISEGVADAYYVTIPAGDTVRTLPDNVTLIKDHVTHGTRPNVSPGNFAPVEYTHPEIPGRARRGRKVRLVFVADDDCFRRGAPTIDAPPLTIQAGVRWDPMGADWSVSPTDWITDDTPASFAQKFETVLQAPRINPDNPTPGTYIVWHVAVGICGDLGVLMRAVQVQ